MTVSHTEAGILNMCGHMTVEASVSSTFEAERKREEKQATGNMLASLVPLLV